MTTSAIPATVRVAVVEVNTLDELRALVASTPHDTLARMAIGAPTLARLAQIREPTLRDYERKTREAQTGGRQRLVPERDQQITGRARGWRPETALAWLTNRPGRWPRRDTDDTLLSD